MNVKRYSVPALLVLAVVVFAAPTLGAAEEVAKGTPNRDRHETTIMVVYPDRGEYVVDFVRTPRPWVLGEHVVLAEDGKTVVGHRGRTVEMTLRGRLEALVRTGVRRPISELPPLDGAMTEAGVVRLRCFEEVQCLSTICIPICGAPGEIRTCGLSCSDCMWITVCG